MTPEVYRWLADGVLTLHALFVSFVIGGLVLILIGWARSWRWTRNPWLRFAHLGAIGFVMAEAWFGVPCPLTVIENDLRRQAGQTGYDLSFVGYWLQKILFYDLPPWVFALLYSTFALLVVATFVAYPPRRTRGSQ